MNKDKISKKIKEEFQNVKLTQEEKSRIFEHVMATPLPSPYTPIRSKSGFTFSRLSYIAIFLIFIFVGGISTSYASLSALPGEKLYFVKLKITEPVLDSLSFTPEAKVKREAIKAFTRIEEAEKLIEKDALTKDNRVFLETEFKKHADNFKDKILNSKKIKEESRSELKAYFDGSLYKYTESIQKIKSQKEKILDNRNIKDDDKLENENENKDENKDEYSNLEEIKDPIIEQATLLEKSIQEKILEKIENINLENNQNIKVQEAQTNIELN